MGDEWVPTQGYTRSSLKAGSLLLVGNYPGLDSLFISVKCLRASVRALIQISSIHTTVQAAGTLGLFLPQTVSN